MTSGFLGQFAFRTALYSIIAAGLAAAAAPAAQAQVAGQYAGQDSDGFGVTLIIYQPTSGKAQLSLVRLAAHFYCDGKLLLTQGQATAYGAALVLAAPFKDGHVKFAGSSNDLSAVTGTVQADGDTLSGTLTGYASLFSGTRTPPDDAEAKSCVTHDLAFKAALLKPTNP